MARSPSLVRHPAVDDWLALGADGRVTVRSGKVDVGQRISASLARVAAAELGVALSRVCLEPRETGRVPDEGYTSGSNSMEHSGIAIRCAAGTARRHLLAMAAEALSVEAGTLEVSDGLVRTRAHNRTVTFWDLTGGRPFGIPVDPLVEPAAGEAYAAHAAGDPTDAAELRELVEGRARFIHDLQLPGMLHARVVRPPHYHARLAGLEEGVEARIAPARLVRIASFLAVAAEDEHRAVRAAAQIAAAARWAPERGLEPQDVAERLVSNPRVSLPVVGGVPQAEPVPARAPPPPGATVSLEARYARPYQMHGSIGPSAALALAGEDGLEVWTHSQGIYPLRTAIAEALDLDPDAIRVRHVRGAGCYGHNGADDAALDAVLVARAMPGVPVLLKWSREDEHGWEPYGPAMVVELAGSVDADGRVVAWSHESFSDTHRGRPRPGANRAGPARLLAMRLIDEDAPVYHPEPTMEPHAGIHRNADPLYAFPAPRVVKHLVRDLPLRTSALRTLGALANVFALESFMDELAEAGGVDALELRLRHLEDARARAVLEAAAEGIGWGAATRDGQGRGLAFARYKNAKAYAAVGVELRVDEAAAVHLERAVIAADAGQVVDPDGLRAQLEGGLVQAASWALYEEVTFDAQGITSRDWDSYPILRFDNVPAIETVLLDRPGEPFLGAGEASSGPTVAAIANAIHRACGLRLRALPFTPDAIKAAALA